MTESGFAGHASFSSPAMAGGRARRLTCIILLIVTAVFALVGRSTYSVAVSKDPQGFYAALTDAFLAGQTYLKAKPDPALATLANPWAGAQGVARLQDATYYQGRYYVYFGLAPVLLLCAPWRLLTGAFLTDEALTGLFAYAGIVTTVLLFLWAWRRWFRELSPGWLVLALLIISFGDFVVVLTEFPYVWPAPIACAHFCVMVALVGVAWSLNKRETCAAHLGLGLASLFWGLAVASRPSYVLSLPTLGIPIASHLAVSCRRHGFPARATLSFLAWSILPAAAVGVAIAAYNYVRFGNILEFGMSYQLVDIDQRFMRLMGWSNDIIGHIRTYLFAKPLYLPYFPFLALKPHNWGMLWCAPLSALALVFPITLFSSTWRRDPVWAPFGLTLLVGFLAQLLSLGLFAFTHERYVPDYLPLATLLGLLTALCLRHRLSKLPRRRMAAFAAWGFGAAGLWTLVHAALLLLGHHPQPERLRALARVANRLTYAVERACGVRYGPITLRVRFAHPVAGQSEPLLVSAHGSDVLFVTPTGANEIQIGFHHAGAGGPTSDPIAITPGKEHEIFIDLGCLYPPKEHPAFSNWPEPLADVLLRRVVVSFDGQLVLNAGSTFFPTYPGDIHVGENPGGLITSVRFSGSLVKVAQQGIPPVESLHGPPGEGPVRMVVQFPSSQVYHREPLISTGHPTAGDLLYVIYDRPGKIRFGHDSWNGGAVETEAVDYDPTSPQVIEVDMASLRQTAGPSLRWATLMLRYNGRLLLCADRPFHASLPAEMIFGFNGAGSTASSYIFSGKISNISRIHSIPPPRPVQAGHGPLHLAVRLPPDRIGRNEPLLVTGHTGAADVVYARYEDESHIRLGYDHWSRGGPVSPAIPIDYLVTHTLEISLGSLYPAADDKAWGNTATEDRRRALDSVVIKLDGQSILAHACAAYPTAPHEIEVGLNAIGASTCDPQFTGKILAQERLGLQSLAAQP